MAQTSISSYFATRKRAAGEDTDILKAKKFKISDPVNDSLTVTKEIYQNKEYEVNSTLQKKLDAITEQEVPTIQRNKVVAKLDFDSVITPKQNTPARRAGTPKPRSKKVVKDASNQPSINAIFQTIQTTKNIKITQEINEKTPPTTPVKNLENKNNEEKITIEKIPSKNPVIKNALDNLQTSNSSISDMSLSEIKNKLTRSARLAELKASLSKYNKQTERLKELEKQREELSSSSKSSQGLTLKAFDSIELEVQLSPKKVVSPAKQYLSPKKDVSSPRKNLLGLLSPTKPSCSTSTSSKSIPAYQRYQHLASPSKSTLTLPFKYRSLAEMFRSIDTVCAMLFNRKETITFNKLKPAVQSMMRRNLTMEHFAQIKYLQPDAYTLHWEKIKSFASKNESYELVIVPTVDKCTNKEDITMSPTCLLERRRNFFNALIEKLKDYHHEFLTTLEPPMIIPREKLTRWHPEFDIEKVPDIEKAELPKQPEEDKLTTGQEVLEKARDLFSCNTRMEKALERLKEIEASKPPEERQFPVSAIVPPSLKGLPKALLEKVRAKQAAKALEAMTRSSANDKEAIMYSRLPEIARLMRNTFVAEKKGVLPLEECIIKLNNSYRSYLTNSEIEEHLKLLSKAVPGWLVFHEVRRTLFVKLSRDGDMNKVMVRLEQLVKEKSSISS